MTATLEPAAPPALGTTARLRAEGVSLGYDDRVVVERLDLAVPDRATTAVVGSNACGKSTLLRGMARLLSPREGRVVLDGRAYVAYSAVAVVTAVLAAVYPAREAGRVEVLEALRYE